jgi:NAD(P)-dependent dehydrogenase (short-subunit alcohol dehydrogenase family)
MDFTGQHVVVVGGSSGMGLATARAAVRAGARVTIASRSPDKLEAARTATGAAAVEPIDVTNDADVVRAFARIGAADHVVVTAANVNTGPIRTLPVSAAQAGMNSKFWGAYRVAAAAEIAAKGSLTLVSGAYARRPAAGVIQAGAINAALEGLTRGLALELAPVRVNCVSPGLVDTPLFDFLPAARREAMFAQAAQRLPLGRTGAADDIALQILACMANPFMTGSVVTLDGGAVLA